MEENSPTNIPPVESSSTTPSTVPPGQVPPEPAHSSFGKQFRPLILIFGVLMILILVGSVAAVFLSVLKPATPDPKLLAQNYDTEKSQDNADFQKSEPVLGIEPGSVQTILISQSSDSASESGNPSGVLPTDVPAILEDTKKDNSLPEGYGAVVFKFYLPPNIKNFASLNIATDKEDFGEKSSFMLINPNGKIVDLPVFDWTVKGEVQKSTEYEESGKSLTEKISKSTYVFKLYSIDPDVAPLEGDWQFKVVAEGGIEIVFGYITL